MFSQNYSYAAARRNGGLPTRQHRQQILKGHQIKESQRKRNLERKKARQEARMKHRSEQKVGAVKDKQADAEQPEEKPGPKASLPDPQPPQADKRASTADQDPENKTKEPLRANDPIVTVDSSKKAEEPVEEKVVPATEEKEEKEEKENVADNEQKEQQKQEEEPKKDVSKAKPETATRGSGLPIKPRRRRKS